MIFALAGNPNSGKTTLFNNLTGSSAHVGNWPGVTVDKKTGTYRKNKLTAQIVDLPGIYSLSPYTPEEIISRNFLVDQKPDCIINIVDATNLERNLYLTTQILEIEAPVVVALNMIDSAEKLGIAIDIEALSKELGVRVVPISALKGLGTAELMEVAFAEVKKPRKGFSVLTKSKVADMFAKVLKLNEKYKVDNPVFHTVKMIEDDELEVYNHLEVAKAVSDLKQEIQLEVYEEDFESVVADARYNYITEYYCKAVTKPQTHNQMTKSDKIDRVMTHKYWGIPIFLLIMFAVFHLTFSQNFLFLGIFIPEGTFSLPIIGTDSINSPGFMLFSAVEILSQLLTDAVVGIMPEGTWFTSLVCDGILGGVLAVLSFVPQIMVLFLFISILEESGYMSRVAFIMDKALRKFGLSGKALMPLIMCFGCAVPGIMATRTLNNEQERQRTIMLTPFFSCGAKLPVWAAFAGVFSQAYMGLNAEVIVFSMYILGIAIAIVASLVLKSTVLKGEIPSFLMELPPYHSPQFRNVMIFLWQKLKHYIFRAATIIAGALLVIWFLSSFSFTLQFVTDSGQSILGVVSQWLRYVFVPLGFGMGDDGWKFVVAALSGLIAKEMVVGTMGTFAGVDNANEVDDISATALGAMMLGIGGTLGAMSVAVPAMFAFMAFNLLSVPCMSAVAAARGELHSKKSFWFAIGFWLFTAYFVSALIFWFGVLAIALWWLALLIGLLVLGSIVALFVIRRNKISKLA